jgi:hypothetical protein
MKAALFAGQSTCDQTRVLMSLTMFLSVAVNKSSHLMISTTTTAKDVLLLEFLCLI